MYDYFVILNSFVAKALHFKKCYIRVKIYLKFDFAINQF